MSYTPAAARPRVSMLHRLPCVGGVGGGSGVWHRAVRSGLLGSGGHTIDRTAARLHGLQEGSADAVRGRYLPWTSGPCHKLSLVPRLS